MAFRISTHYDPGPQQRRKQLYHNLAKALAYARSRKPGLAHEYGLRVLHNMVAAHLLERQYQDEVAAWKRAQKRR